MKIHDLLTKYNGGIFRGSQKRLAKKCGIKESHMSHVLSGRRSPGEELLLKMAAELGVSVEELDRVLPKVPQGTHSTPVGNALELRLARIEARLDAIESGGGSSIRFKRPAAAEDTGKASQPTRGRRESGS